MSLPAGGRGAEVDAAQAARQQPALCLPHVRASCQAACADQDTDGAASAAACRQYTFYTGCPFIHPFGCAAEFATYQAFNKISTWTSPTVSTTGLPPSSNLGVPWVWISWDCSLTSTSICE